MVARSDDFVFRLKIDDDAVFVIIFFINHNRISYSDGRYVISRKLCLTDNLYVTATR